MCVKGYPARNKVEALVEAANGALGVSAGDPATGSKSGLSMSVDRLFCQCRGTCGNRDCAATKASFHYHGKKGREKQQQVPLECCDWSSVAGLSLRLACKCDVHTCNKERRGKWDFRCTVCQRRANNDLATNQYLNSNGIFEVGETWSWDLWVRDRQRF